MLKSPTHPAKTIPEGPRGAMSPRSSSADGKDRRTGSGGPRPRDGSDTRTSSSERREGQDIQRGQRTGKSSKQDASAAPKSRQHPGTALHSCCLTLNTTIRAIKNNASIFSVILHILIHANAFCNNNTQKRTFAIEQTQNYAKMGCLSYLKVTAA